MQIDPTIFKAYDIRGIYPTQLDEKGAYAIARAFATLMLKENSNQPLTVIVGGDMRLSTPALKEQVISALLDTGVNVVDIGMVSTTTFYFAAGYFKYQAGIQISASHNPKQYNGLKVVRAGAVQLNGETGIKDLYSIVTEESFAPVAAEKGILSIKEHVTEIAVKEYLKLLGSLEIKPMKVVVDVANATGALDYGELFKHLPVELIKMNFELDGNMPSHEADPSKEENRKDLEARVLSENAQLGVAADGDSDRVFIIDDTGKVIPSAILFTILAHIEREQDPNATLAYELRVGKLVEDEFGGTPLVETPVGSAIMRDYMAANNAVFGGELSGHYNYRFPWGTFEAPVYLVAKLMAWLSKQEKPLSEIVDSYRRYAAVEVAVEIPHREVAHDKIELIKSKYTDGKVSTLDGIKVVYPDYWFSLRPSNTEPIMRLLVEAKDPAVMAAKRDELLEIIRD